MKRKQTPQEKAARRRRRREFMTVFINGKQKPEKAALTFAEVVTTTGHTMDADLMERMKYHYSDDAIVELAALIAHQNLSTRFNRALGVKE